MAEKDWTGMSVSEKCEYLYMERRRMIDFINGLAADIGNLRGQINRAVPKLNEVAMAVERLEARVREKDGKKGVT